jgi:hypothetical protein
VNEAPLVVGGIILTELGRARRGARSARFRAVENNRGATLFSAGGAAATRRRRPRQGKANVRSVGARCRTESEALLSAPCWSGAPEVLGARKGRSGTAGFEIGAKSLTCVLDALNKRCGAVGISGGKLALFSVQIVG